MKRNFKKVLTSLLALVIMVNEAAVMPAFAAQTDDTVKIVEHIREVDFSQFTDSDFSANTDTTVILAEGIKFITSGSSNQKPKIETGMWQSSESETYTNRLNTGGGGRWTDDFTDLRRAIIIEGVEAGDEIEIVYGSSSVNRTLNELIGLDGSGIDGSTVLTATSTHTPFKYTLTVAENGTYYYYDPQGTYHIYGVKVTSFTYEEAPASYEYVREIDFSQFSDSDFSADTDTTVVLAEGIKFITSGSSNEKPKIETGTWQSADAGTYSYRLNTGGGGRWTNDNSGLRRAIIIEDVEIGDKIEIVYGSSSKNRTMNELIGIDGSGNNGSAVLTATATHTPFKYSLTAEEAGTYCYYDPQGTYHIYAVKVMGYTNTGNPGDPDDPDTSVFNWFEMSWLPNELYAWLPGELNSFVAYGSSAHDEEEDEKIVLEWYYKESANKYYIYELTGGKTLFAEVDNNNSYEFKVDGRAEYAFAIEAETSSGAIISNNVILKVNESGYYSFELTDGDSDELADVYELIIRTDLMQSDSEGDSLPDGYEVFILGTNPLSADTDSNSVSDGDEDFDADGLTNLEEYLLGTDPWNPDTDGDDLSDSDEAIIYGTDPLNPDTDGDGLLDGEEGYNGLFFTKYNVYFDPKNPKTDGITLDGERIIQQIDEKEVITHDGAITNVFVEMDTNGSLERHLNIESKFEKDILLSDVVGLVGDPFNFAVSTEFSEATLTFTIDKAKLGETNFEDLLFLWFDEENQNFVELETVINEQDSTISTTTTHFSQYMIVDGRAWFAVWSDNQYVDMAFNNLPYQPNARGIANSLPTSKEAALELSKSFGENNYLLVETSPLDWEKAQKYCESYGGQLVTITSKEENDFVFSLINQGSKLEYWIGGIWAANSQPIWATGESFVTFNPLIDNWGANLSGNLVTSKYYPNRWCKGRITQPITSYTGGVSFVCEWNSEIVLKDSDEDGLPDIYETRGMPLANGTIVYTDPNNPDTDGDGIKDGSEINPEIQTQTISNSNAQIENSRIATEINVDGLNDDAKINTEIQPQTVLYSNSQTENLIIATAANGNGLSNGAEMNPEIQTQTYLNSHLEIENLIIATPTDEDDLNNDAEINSEIQTQAILNSKSQIQNSRISIETDEEGLNDSAEIQSETQTQIVKTNLQYQNLSITPETKYYFGMLSSPTLKDSDFDSYNDDVDLAPLTEFKAPVLFVSNDLKKDFNISGSTAEWDSTISKGAAYRLLNYYEYKPYVNYFYCNSTSVFDIDTYIEKYIASVYDKSKVYPTKDSLKPLVSIIDSGISITESNISRIYEGGFSFSQRSWRKADIEKVISFDASIPNKISNGISNKNVDYYSFSKDDIDNTIPNASMYINELLKPTTKISNDEYYMVSGNKINVYMNDLFAKSATVEDTALRELSAQAAMFAYDDVLFPKNTEPVKIQKMLSELSFSNIVSANYHDNVEDNISYTFANRKLSDGTTVVAVVLRGTDEAEWKGNFKVWKNSDNPTTYAYSFNRAAVTLYSDLCRYLLNNVEKNGSIKFWVTGHSRGAAVANILSAMLTNRDTAHECDNDIYGAYFDTISLFNQYYPTSSDNVYAYTFATPNVKYVGTYNLGSLTAGYENIRNYVHDNDFVTEVPLKKWGYDKFGTTTPFHTSNISVGYPNYSYIRAGEIKYSVTEGACTKGVGAFYNAANNVDEYYNKKYNNPLSKNTFFELAYTVIAPGAMKIGGMLDGAGTLSTSLVGNELGDVVAFFFFNKDTTIYYAHIPQTYYDYIEKRHN